MRASRISKLDEHRRMRRRRSNSAAAGNIRITVSSASRQASLRETEARRLSRGPRCLQSSMSAAPRRSVQSSRRRGQRRTATHTGADHLDAQSTSSSPVRRRASVIAVDLDRTLQRTAAIATSCGRSSWAFQSLVQIEPSDASRESRFARSSAGAADVAMHANQRLSIASESLQRRHKTMPTCSCWHAQHAAFVDKQVAGASAAAVLTIDPHSHRPRTSRTDRSCPAAPGSPRGGIAR